MALRTEKDTAAELGLVPGTLSNWRVQGRGPEFLKIGGAVRYSDEAIAAFKEQARRRSTSETEAA